MKKSLFLSALAVTVLFSVVAFATADVQTYEAPAEGTVTVNATVNPKMTLTVTTPDAGQGVDFGAVDPGTMTGGKQVGLSVDSNQNFDVAIAQNDGAFTAQGIVLARDLAASTNNGKGAGVTFVDNYTLDVPWTADPGNYSGTVVYTVTQN